jgi:hypothetical protein
MAGGPSHLETWDPKPMLAEMHGQPMPESFTRGKQIAQLQGQKLMCYGPQHKFKRFGQSGVEICELFTQIGSVADEICWVRSMTTEAINHDPAHMFMNTGSQIAGRPSMGAWLSYGLGQENANLPSFVVLITKDKGGQPLGAHLWGTGFLPNKHQGVLFRAAKDPVLYLDNPPGVNAESRRLMLDRLRELHQHRLETIPDAEIQNRIEHYEMAFAMQSSIPDVVDISSEPQAVLDSYGPEVAKPGTFAANCLLARRLAERGVRFIQLYHQDWDHHGGLPSALPKICQETDQPAAALVKDLKRCGLLDDTLVIWGGEFGRTNYCQGKIQTSFGRDHHPRCFSIWLAGGGVNRGAVYGETCEFGYNITAGGVHVHDLHATVMHLLGIDHERLTYKFQGRRYRLTDVHGNVVPGLLA